MFELSATFDQFCGGSPTKAAIAALARPVAAVTQPRVRDGRFVPPAPAANSPAHGCHGPIGTRHELATALSPLAARAFDANGRLPRARGPQAHRWTIRFAVRWERLLLTNFHSELIIRSC